MGEQSVQSVGTAAYDTLLELLRGSREAKGVSQRALSKRLGRPFTYIAKIENGTRRVDVVELVQICLELENDPLDIVAKVKAQVELSSQ